MGDGIRAFEGGRQLGRSAVVVEFLNGEDKVVDAGAVRAVGPFAPIADAVDFVVESDRAALGDTSLDTQLAYEQVPAKNQAERTSAVLSTLFLNISSPCAPSSLVAHSFSFSKSMACSRAQSSTSVRSGICL